MKITDGWLACSVVLALLCCMSVGAVLYISSQLWFSHHLLENKQGRSSMTHETVFIKSVSGGRPGARIDRYEVTRGGRVSIQSYQPGRGPRWGVHAMWPPSPRNLVISSRRHLGKGELPRIRSTISASEGAERHLSVETGRLNWTRDRASDRQYGWPLCNSAGGNVLHRVIYKRYYWISSGRSFIRPGAH